MTKSIVRILFLLAIPVCLVILATIVVTSQQEPETRHLFPALAILYALSLFICGLRRTSLSEHDAREVSGSYEANPEMTLTG